MLISRVAPAKFSTSAPIGEDQTIRVRSISPSGVVSTSEVTASVPVAAPAGHTVTDNVDEDPAWGGTKTNTAVSGTALALSGSNLTGTYLASFTEAGVRRLVATVNGKLQNVKRTWEDCSFRWGDEACAKRWNAFYLDGFECSEGLRWRDAHFRWSSLPAACRTWAGPIDIVEALTPSIVVGDGAGDLFEGPAIERTVANPTATITLRRPHESYEPELTTMNTKIWSK